MLITESPGNQTWITASHVDAGNKFTTLAAFPIANEKELNQVLVTVTRKQSRTADV
jgi:hypothetical protein